MNDYSSSPGYVNDYLEAGWEVPIPLPPGKKYPPKTGMTGRIARVTKNDVENSWKNVSDEANVALRMQVRGKFDVIALDVDHYESKQGRTYLDDLMEELGDLNLDNIPRSTRRGPKSPSGQFFFKVPKGNEWESSACPDVDVVQMTHRYSAVWPSAVDGDQYRWYVGEEQADIPHVRELPTLPDRLVNHLTRGKKGRTSGKRQALGGYREALNWLRDNLSGWYVAVTGSSDPDITMSPYLRDSSTSDEFLDALENNAHDTMVEAVHKCVMAATEGHHGLKAALFYIGKAFVSEVVEDGRRGEKEAKDEFERAVTGEVEKLAADVEAGLVRILNITPDMAMPNFKQYLGLNPPVDIAEILREPSATVAVAEIIARLKPSLLVHTSDEDGNTLYMENKRHELTESRLRRLINLDVLTYLKEELAKLPDEPDKDSYEASAKAALEAYRHEANCLGTKLSVKPLTQILAEKLIDQKRSMPKNQLDTKANLIGIGNDVLDLHLAAENPQGTLKDWLRPRTIDDCVTYSIAGDIHKGIELLEAGTKTHSEMLINAIFPTKELREFAQAACGYSVYGANKLQKVFVWYGHGGGGKGSLSESIATTLGNDYVSSLKPSQFAKSQSANPDPEVARSLRTRITFVDETDKGDRINAGVLKSATERRSGRELYSNQIVSSSGNTVTLMTNNVFHFEHDSGVARRLAVIPFSAERNDVRDAQPHSTGTDSAWRERDVERAFILEWLARGFIRAHQPDSILDIENYPADVAAATEEFVKTADPAQEFFGRLEYTGNDEDFLSPTELSREFQTVVGGLSNCSRAFSMKLSTWMKDQGKANTKVKRKGINGYRGWQYIKD